MPDQAILPEIPDVDFEREPFVDEEDGLSAPEAGRLVLNVFEEYARHREKHVEANWLKNERLYYGYVRPRFWTGTNIRRSSLPELLVSDQIETMYPEVVSTLFGTEPYWFECVGERGVEPGAVEAIQARLAYVLEQQGEMNGRTAVAELKRAFRSCSLYSNGYVEVGYGESGPFVEWLDIRDVYLSPNTGNWVDGSPAWIKRRFMTVAELQALRDTPGMDIPSDEVLNGFANNKAGESSDLDKIYGELLQGKDKDQDFPDPNPVRKEIEVLVYQSKERIIWVLGRKHVAYNAPNRWEMLTLCGAPFLLVLGSQYGRGIPDLLEYSQKFIQALKNGYADEIALNLNPPRTALHSALGHPSQLAFRPGNLLRSATPDKDFVPQFTSGITRDVWAAISEEQRAAQKRTGLSELVQSGLPTPSNSNRTATGIRGHSDAASRRLFTIVDNFETYLLVPVLRKLHRIIQIAEAGQEGLPGKAPNGQTVDVSGQALQGDVKFRIIAGSKMIARERVAQSLPFLIQYLFNPQVMAQAQAAGRVANFDDIDRLVQDATGARDRYVFYRHMSEEEKAAMAQNPQADQEAQQKDKDLEVRREIAAMKAKTEEMKIAAESDMSAEKIAVEILKILSTEQIEGLKARTGAEKSAEKPKKTS